MVSAAAAWQKKNSRRGKEEGEGDLPATPSNPPSAREEAAADGDTSPETIFFSAATAAALAAPTSIAREKSVRVCATYE